MKGGFENQRGAEHVKRVSFSCSHAESCLRVINDSGRKAKDVGEPDAGPERSLRSSASLP